MFSKILFNIFHKDTQSIRLLKTSKLKKSLFTLFLFVVIIGSVCAIISPLIIYSDDIKKLIPMFNLGIIFLIIGFYIMYTICFISVFGYMYAYCYLDKNINNYLVLPINPKTFINTKLVFIYYNVILICGIVFLPFLALYFVYGGFSPISLLSALFYFLTLPIIMIYFANVIIGTIMFFVNKLKNKVLAKYLVVGLYMAIIFAIYISFLIITQTGGENEDIQALIASVTGIMNKIKPVFFYANLGVSVLNHHDIFNFIIMLVLSIGGYLSIIYFSKVYYPGVIGFNEGGSIFKRKNKTNVKMQNNSMTKWFFMKEFKELTRNTTYFFNTLFGNIIVVVIYLGIMAYQYFINGLKEEMASININSLLSIPLVIVIVISIGTFFTLFNNGAASSLSREAKNIKIIQSLPINFTKAFFGKVLFHFLVDFFTLFIFIIIAMSMLSINITYMGIAILTIIIVTLATILIPICIDLRFYNFDWESETVVVKRSRPIILNMVCSFVLMGVIYAMSALLYINTQDIKVLAFSLAGFFILLLFVLIFVYNKLTKRFMSQIQEK
ncbi:MAG: hypothetical protein LBT75_05380 [Bacilli bacterium]|jgi:ABC-2 type transport system permease protein|nr:hypothetical protein [Bacilli bacterium]